MNSPDLIDPPKPPASQPMWLKVAIGVLIVLATTAAVYFFGMKPSHDRAAARAAEEQHSALVAKVQRSIQKKFDTTPDVQDFHMEVKKVDLVNKSGNEYTGLATIHAGNGQERSVPLEVTYDGNHLIWKIPPKALWFALPDDEPE